MAYFYDCNVQPEHCLALQLLGAEILKQCNCPVILTALQFCHGVEVVNLILEVFFFFLSLVELRAFFNVIHFLPSLC